MNKIFDYFVSPVSHKPLEVRGNFLLTADGSEKYEIRSGVPILLPPDVQPCWDRELIEAIMRQYRVLEKFGFTEDETVELMKKCRMYADVETMIDECKKVGLKLEIQKEFQISEKHIAVATVFVKE